MDPTMLRKAERELEYMIRNSRQQQTPRDQLLKKYREVRDMGMPDSIALRYLEEIAFL